MSDHHFVDAEAAILRYNGDMNARQFNDWLAAMDISGAEAGRLLGVSANTITRYKRRGGPKMLSLACRALFHRMEEWQ